MRDRNIPLALELIRAQVRCPCVIAEASGVTELTAQSLMDALGGERHGACVLALIYPGELLALAGVSS
jgi:hypothetical protein